MKLAMDANTVSSANQIPQDEAFRIEKAENEGLRLKASAF